MGFNEIALKNFRSYKSKQIKLHPKLNLIVGPNGSGKTNLLEAIYVLAQTKSYRGRDESLLLHGEDWYTLLGKGNKLEQKITYNLKPKKQKLITLNGTKTKPEHYVGRLPVVLFEPNSVMIAVGAPVARRGFIDGVLCSIDSQYLVNLIQYKRVLKQRNTLLRSKPENIESQIFAWDVRLAELGGYIFKKRLSFVEFLDAQASDLYKEMSGKSVPISTKYNSNCSGDDYATELLTYLQKHLPRDVIFGNTGDGIHRDDIEITFGAIPVESVASRGEIRTLTLAYKLLELAYIEKHSQSQPLMLLDDVFSELDTSRREFLLAKLASHQSVITTTDLHGVKNIQSKSHAMIDLGRSNARRRSPASGEKS